MDDLIKRATAALEGTTEGPWSVFNGKRSNVLSVCIGKKANGRLPCVVNWSGFDGNDLPHSENSANATFIAAARQLVPEMRDRIEQLEAEVEAEVERLHWERPTAAQMAEVLARAEAAEAKLATARNDALEEAAKVGAEAATDWANDNSEKAARMGIWNTVHAAIRSLKSTNQT